LGSQAGKFIDLSKNVSKALHVQFQKQENADKSLFGYQH